MIGEIIAIGDELTSGRITNSTSGYAAHHLFLLGHEVQAMHTIGDAPELIGTTLKAALDRSDFVLVTGGLGATTDDMTTEAVIAALDLNTQTHPGVLANIQNRLRRENRTLDAQTLSKLAQLPEGAEVLDEEYRMAGYLLRYQGKPLYFLPGVPPQMRSLMQSHVLPGLQSFSTTIPIPVCQQVYRTCGLPEITINRQLQTLEKNPLLQIGYYPVGSEVHISLTLKDTKRGFQDPLFLEADREIRLALGDHLFGTGEETIASATGKLLQEKGLMLGVAESCTGGEIGATITDTSGSSTWFKGGVIVYSNALKQALLDVSPETLEQHGAVSAETARAMVSGTVARLGCDIAVSATGIAGPGGGSADKPVGTVYIGLQYQGRNQEQRCQFLGNREQVREKTVHTALDMVRRAVLEG